MIVKYSVFLSFVEVGLGSLLHALRLPLAGHMLSLNQGAFLTRATLQTTQANSALAISNIVALLKSLSPAGKKLTPMLAISAQGVLYYLGVSLFGVNLVGQLVGMMLLSLWGFIQPLLIYYVLFGQQLFDVAQYFLNQIQPILSLSLGHIFYAVAAVALLKTLVGVWIVIVFRKMSESQFESLVKKIKISEPRSTRESSLITRIARELFRPVFVISLIMTAVFYFVTRPMGVEIVWSLMRPVALGFLLFGLIKFVPFERILSAQAKDGGFQQMLAESLKRVKERM